MITDYCVRLVLTLFAFGLCKGLNLSRSSYAVPPSSLQLLFEPCKNDLPYRLEANVSLSRCVFDCMSRSRCRSIMYRRLASVCGFVDVDDVISSATASQTKSICVYTSVEGLDRSILGACADNTCSDTETCMLTESGHGYICVKSECPFPPDIFNGHAVTNYQQVKGLVWYNCVPGLKTIGTGIRLCQENAKWAEMDGGCGVTCPEPQVIDTANLVSVVGERWRQTTVLMYQCKPGFEDDQGRTQINSTCTEMSAWVPSKIACCKPGWKIFADRCWDYFDGSGFNSLEDMRIFCSQQDSTLLELTSLAHITEVKDNILVPDNVGQTILNNALMSNISSPDRIQEIQQCIEDEGVTIPDNILQGSYADLVSFGQANGLLNCSDMDMWATGQPDMAKECTAYGQNTGYKLLTVPCVWAISGEYGLICATGNIMQ